MLNSIAIISLGSIGKRYVRILKKIRPDIKILLYRSGIGKSYEEEEFVDRITHNFDDVLNPSIQAAILTSPANQHINQAISLIKSNKHVLIEKPLSNSTDKIDELLKLQRNKNSVVLVGYCLRYLPDAQMVYNYANTALDDILNVRVEVGSYLPSWRKKDYKSAVSSLSELGGGVLLELSHEFDYLHWFFGHMKNIYAEINFSNTLGIEVEDSVDLIFNSGKNFTISMHLDFNTHTPRRKCSIFTTKTDIFWDVLSNRVVKREIDGGEIINNFNNQDSCMYEKQLEHFIECIEKNKIPKVTIDDGLKVLNIIKAAWKSDKYHKRINII